MNQELPDVQAGFRKCQGDRDQIANIYWIVEKAKEFHKTSTFAALTTLKPLTEWITTNSGKFLKRWEHPDHLTCLLGNLYAGQEATVRTRHGTMDWFKIGEGEQQGCIFNSAYLTYMPSTSCEMLGWMNHKLESRLLG